jgi:hypothetical protein
MKNALVSLLKDIFLINFLRKFILNVLNIKIQFSSPLMEAYQPKQSQNENLNTVPFPPPNFTLP